MITLFKTDDAWSSLVLRFMLGLVMFPHMHKSFWGGMAGSGLTGR